jgi:general secretion pathway protein D
MEDGNVLDLGVKWSWPKIAAGTLSDSTLHGSGAPAGPSWPWGLQIGYTPTKEFTDSLLVTLNLLSQNYDVTVMANPTVVAQEGKEASVGVITDEYFEILTQGFYTNSELQKIQAGTTLKIIPRVGSDGRISLDMSVEVSDVVARGSSNLPVVTRRIAQSTVGVQNGGTAVVAGLMDNRTRNNHEHVPGLGRIPFLGRLFRNDTHSDTARQVAVFVTARLIPLSSLDTPEPVLPKPIKPVDRALFRAELLNYLYTAGISEFEVKNVPSRAMDNASPQKEKKK